MEQPTIKYQKVVSGAKEPKLATDGSSGYDIYACRVLDKKTRKVVSNLEKPVKIKPGESVLFGSGIALEIPPTHHAVVPSRTGLAVRNNIEVGYPGATIDSDYRGEFTVLLRNFGRKSFSVGKFMRIAQLIFYPRIVVRWVETEKLSETKRGNGGLGSTGLY